MLHDNQTNEAIARSSVKSPTTATAPPPNAKPTTSSPTPKAEKPPKPTAAATAATTTNSATSGPTRSLRRLLPPTKRRHPTTATSPTRHCPTKPTTPLTPRTGPHHERHALRSLPTSTEHAAFDARAICAPSARHLRARAFIPRTRGAEGPAAVGPVVVDGSAASRWWERPVRQPDDERVRRPPHVAVLECPCVGHGSIADAIEQARRSELLS
jgi:hypothetical protein